MSEQELKEIIERHQHYLNRDVEGWEGMKANLEFADLRGATLRNVILRKADLRGAILEFADFGGADLSYAHMVNADLEGAYLMDADLEYADLRCANLEGADMTCADFEYAILNGARLDKDEEYRKGVILSEPIRGWKKCEGNVIVELEIPKWSVVFCINGKKCRTNRAKVISLSRGKIARSVRDNSFTYEVGKELEILNFDMSYNVECSSGIHFFKSKDDAEAY